MSYERPSITRHAVGVMNQFGRSHSTRPQTHVEGRALTMLLEEFGSPLWLLSEATLRDSYRRLQEAFSRRYPRTVIAYSYKTNYLSSVCSILHQEGAWAEVVSGFEYDHARTLGVPGERIVFNGPCKRKEELRRAMEEGARIHADCLEELSEMESLATRRTPMGIRINLQVNSQPWDRFGFNLESGQALEAVRWLASSAHLELKGIHCHLGTYLTDPSVYGKALGKLIPFLQKLKSDFGVKIEWLDLGGGFASKNVLHGSWMPAEYACPSFEQYAEEICSRLLSSELDLPTLFLEPGRSLVDEAMHLGCRVLSNRRRGEGRRALVLDAGVNLLYTSAWYRHEIVPGVDSGGLLEEVDVFGPLCMQIDCLQLGVSLPPLRRGDPVLIRKVGAYNFSQSMQFIQLRPAVVMLSPEGVELVRRREDGSCVRALEQLPHRLNEAWRPSPGPRATS
ncbi:MAG: diaminopimelate decarboxylase [Candidatus Xenobia bacterium]